MAKQILCSWDSPDAVTILDIKMVSVSQPVGRRITRTATVSALSIALKFRQAICVVSMTDSGSRAWFGRFEKRVVGQAQFEVSMKDLQENMPTWRLILELQS